MGTWLQVAGWEFVWAMSDYSWQKKNSEWDLMLKGILSDPEMIIESINANSELIVLSSCGMSFMIGVTPGVDLGQLISVNGGRIERQDQSTVGFKTKLKLIRLFRANENLFIDDYYKDLRAKWMRGGV